MAPETGATNRSLVYHLLDLSELFSGFFLFVSLDLHEQIVGRK